MMYLRLADRYVVTTAYKFHIEVFEDRYVLTVLYKSTLFDTSNQGEKNRGTEETENGI